MITSLQLVLQDKHSDGSYEEYITKADEKCRKFEIDDVLSIPKCRRISSRIDETPCNVIMNQQNTTTESSFSLTLLI